MVQQYSTKKLAQRALAALVGWPSAVIERIADGKGRSYYVIDAAPRVGIYLRIDGYVR